MIEVTSLPFFIFVFCCVLTFRVLPTRLRSSIFLPTTNLIFLWLAMPNVNALISLAIFFILAYLSIWISYLRKFKILLCSLGLILLVFAYLKSYQILFFLPQINNLPTVVGLSYILIRSLQIIIDVYEGTLSKPPSFLSFSIFLSAWPMLLSGPIQNYQEFCLQRNAMENDKLSQKEIENSFTKIIWGIFSVLVLAGLAHDIHQHFREIMLSEITLNETSSVLQSFFLGSHVFSPLILSFSAFFYLVYLYFNFSGYTDIVIGVGRLIGLQLPENFNKPWASKNFLDFWSRWHMTLANWFKTYVFNPQMRFLMKRWPNSTYVPYYAVIAFFITFFLLGIWHGPTLEFFVCSAILGLGVSINKLWQLKSRSLLGKTYHSRLIANSSYQILSSAMTLSYAAMSVIPFWCSMDNIIKVNLLFGIGGIGLSFVGITLFVLPVSFIALKFNFSGKNKFFNQLQPISMGGILAVIAVYAFLYPPVDLNFVYQAF